MVETKSMNMPKISIIVPVYKAEGYLHRCVDNMFKHLKIKNYCNTDYYESI